MTALILLLGKSPVIIDPKCDLELAARRVLWGKIANAGQVSNDGKQSLVYGLTTLAGMCGAGLCARPS